MKQTEAERKANGLTFHDKISRTMPELDDDLWLKGEKMIGGTAHSRTGCSILCPFRTWLPSVSEWLSMQYAGTLSCRQNLIVPQSVGEFSQHTLSFGHYDRRGRLSLSPYSCRSIRLMCIITQAACIVEISGWGRISRENDLFLTGQRLTRTLALAHENVPQEDRWSGGLPR